MKDKHVERGDSLAKSMQCPNWLWTGDKTNFTRRIQLTSWLHSTQQSCEYGFWKLSDTDSVFPKGRIRMQLLVYIYINTQIIFLKLQILLLRCSYNVFIIINLIPKLMTKYWEKKFVEYDYYLSCVSPCIACILLHQFRFYEAPGCKL